MYQIETSNLYVSQEPGVVDHKDYPHSTKRGKIYECSVRENRLSVKEDTSSLSAL